ncbi:SCY1-RELATED S/T PROTEIN KINASE-LIKE [Salix purpurea]|uniref:SCY1-RELATED S/T PROTEIN KINASE-LIKE n=1 Tax=Salix purpurea TaxID=77065 RepID=A0A9Q0ZWB7_SALPP|nr:SCY1-RELATED S/T PROTEIN KINASE-LIKE [Salix purpurea]
MGFEEYSKNKLVDIIHFMEILTLKDSVKKDTFFHKLPNVAEQLPCQIVLKRQLLPLLACALEFGYGASPGLTALLKMGSSLSDEEFSVKVLPTIARATYGESLSAQVVDEQLSQRSILGSLLKYLSKLQVDEELAIRTNTTILLGNIASYLDEGVRMSGSLSILVEDGQSCDSIDFMKS